MDLEFSWLRLFRKTFSLEASHIGRIHFERAKHHVLGIHIFYFVSLIKMLLSQMVQMSRSRKVVYVFISFVVEKRIISFTISLIGLNDYVYFWSFSSVSFYYTFMPRY